MPNNKRDEEQFSIVRWINYQDASLDNLKKSLRYVADPKSSPARYQRGYHLKIETAFDGIETAYRRHLPAGNRHYKHLVISFGDPALTADKAMEVGTRIADFYGDNYQELLCLHTNIPKRLHCHMIMSCLNLSTGKKFEQNPNEFNKFRDFFDDVMHKYNLPPLRRKENFVVKQSEVLKHEQEKDTEYEREYKVPYATFCVPQPPPINSINLNQPVDYREAIIASEPVLNNRLLYNNSSHYQQIENLQTDSIFTDLASDQELERLITNENKALKLINPIKKCATALINPLIKCDKSPGKLIDVLHKSQIKASSLVKQDDFLIETEPCLNQWIFDGVIVCPDGKHAMPYKGILYDKNGIRMMYENGTRILKVDGDA